MALPFLWDGDFANGVYPFVIGLIPLSISIFSVLKDNDKPNQVPQRDAVLTYLKDGSVSGNATYGFLKDYSSRLRMIGIKFYFKELFAREKANKVLADGLLDNSPDVTAETLKSLQWVTDNAVDVKSQFVFLLEYMVERYDKKKLYDNLKAFCDNTLATMDKLDFKFEELPYPLAKYLATASLLTGGEASEPLFKYDCDFLKCDPDERIISVHTAPLYRMDANAPLKPVAGIYKRNYSKAEGVIVITSKRIVVRTDNDNKDFQLQTPILKNGNDISLDNFNYFCVKDYNFFRFVINCLNNHLY